MHREQVEHELDSYSVLSKVVPLPEEQEEEGGRDDCLHQSEEKNG